MQIVRIVGNYCYKTECDEADDSAFLNSAYLLERVDAKGKVIGFAIFNFLKHDRKTVEIPLEEATLAIGR